MLPHRSPARSVQTAAFTLQRSTDPTGWRARLHGSVYLSGSFSDLPKVQFLVKKKPVPGRTEGQAAGNTPFLTPLVVALPLAASNPRPFGSATFSGSIELL